MKHYKTVLPIMFLVVAAAAIFISGIVSDVHLGDEALHYRMAQYIYHSNVWPVYDPLNQTYGPYKWYYQEPMLWHTFLAAIWKLTGISQAAAQLYQVLYFIILAVSTYHIIKKLYDDKTARDGILIITTMPVVVALSIILHTDIPLAALAALSFMFLINEKYFLSGMVFGLMFIMKRPVYIILPAFLVFIICYNKGLARQRIKNISTFLIASLPFALLALFHRKVMLGMQRELLNMPPALFDNPANINFIFKEVSDMRSLPLNAVIYLGVPLICGVAFYFLNIKKIIINKDAPILAGIAMFMVIYFKVFWNTLIARYLVVCIPFLVIIAARGLSFVKNVQVKRLIVTIAVIQFFLTCIYTAKERIIPDDTKQAYAYIKNNTPVDARIMCSRFDIPLYSDRRCIWNNYMALSEMPYLFWKANDEDMLKVWNKYGIDYLLVDKRRIYDDSKVQHQLGWPYSFVKNMPNLKHLEPVLENKTVSLWKVSR